MGHVVAVEELAGRCRWLSVAALIFATLPAGTVCAQPAPPRDSLEAAYERMMLQPSNPDLAVQYARLAAAQGETRAAITALERVLRQDPRLDNIRLELGSLYLASGSADVAAIYAREALASPSIPPDVAERARQLLAQAELASSPSLLAVSLFAGARHDSDANQATSLSTVSVFSPNLGLVPVANSLTAQPDWSLVLNGQLYHRYDLGLQREGAWETNLSAFDQNFATISHNYDLFLGQFDTGPRIGVGELGEGTVSVRPFLAANYLAYGSQTYAWLYGGGLGAQYRLLPHWQADLRGVGYFGKYYNSSFRPLASDYTGPEFSFIGTLSYSFTDATALAATLYYYQASARQDFYSRRGPGGAVSFATAFDVYGHRIGTTARIGMRYLGYQTGDPVINPNEARNDPIFEAGASLVMPVTRYLNLIAQYDYVRDNSNYGLYRFQDHAVTFGLQVGL